MTIRVLLADDQALLRSAFRVLVDSEPDMEVVGEASDGAEAVRLAKERGADVVLMDIRMPGTDGLAATRLISADPSLAHVRVVILTTFEVDDYVVQSLRAGASGFLGKGSEPEELLSAIRIAAGGEALLSPTATPPAPSGSTPSPSGSARSWSRSPAGTPTTRSPSGSKSAR